MKKIAFLLTKRQIETTSNRVLHLVTKLSKEYRVEVIVNSPISAQRVSKIFTSTKSVTVKLANLIDKQWTQQQRDSMLREWLTYYKDLKVTDNFMFYEQVGFDDYLWNISQRIYPDDPTIYSMMLYVVPGKWDLPPGTDDTFLTHYLYNHWRGNRKIYGLVVDPTGSHSTILDHITTKFIGGRKELYER